MSDPALEASTISAAVPGGSAAALPMRLVLITGMSGAGRSSALKMLEDMGYEAVDNLPLSLLGRLVSTSSAEPRPMAVGIDIRTRDFDVAALLAQAEALACRDGLESRLVFLDCDDDILARRFTETRRRHPLAGDRPVADGIRLERDRVSPLRSRADVVIDTSRLQPGGLRRLLRGYFALEESARLALFVTSFSFRQGLPREADLVFDVRFLENPHYQPDLRPLTGLDPDVGAYVARDPAFAGFWSSLTSLLQPLLPRYDSEGKSYLTIAIGCTGGRHRSVYVAEQLGAWLASEGQAVTIGHRDLDGSESGAAQPACPVSIPPEGREI
jgi:UPF0042 nucleotide-binding protein